MLREQLLASLVQLRPEDGHRPEGESVTEAAATVEKQLQSHFLKFTRLLYYVKLIVQRARVFAKLSRGLAYNDRAQRNANELLQGELQFSLTLLRLSAYEDFENYNALMTSALNTFRRIHRKISPQQRKDLDCFIG